MLSQLDAITVINFPVNPVYKMTVSVYHAQPGVRASYQLLAFDENRSYLGTASTGDIDVEGSYTITFSSTPDHPIRLAILQDDNAVEAQSNTKTSVLLERVDMFTSP
jgi:hypothetical protein